MNGFYLADDLRLSAINADQPCSPTVPDRAVVGLEPVILTHSIKFAGALAEIISSFRSAHFGMSPLTATDGAGFSKLVYAMSELNGEDRFRLYRVTGPPRSALAPQSAGT